MCIPCSFNKFYINYTYLKIYLAVVICGKYSWSVQKRCWWETNVKTNKYPFRQKAA